MVFVSSGGMYAKRLDVETMYSNEGPYDGVAAYAMTKRGQVVLSEIVGSRASRHRDHRQRPASGMGCDEERRAIAASILAHHAQSFAHCCEREQTRRFGWRSPKGSRERPASFGSTVGRSLRTWWGGHGRMPTSGSGCGTFARHAPVPTGLFPGRNSIIDA